MRLAIIGGRDFSDYPRLEEVMYTHFRDGYFDKWEVGEIVSGGAKGADSLGAEFACKQGMKLTEYLPDWEKYGKRAAFLRNEDIISNCDFVLAFWDAVSKGTANSLSIAKRLKKPTLIIYY